MSHSPSRSNPNINLRFNDSPKAESPPPKLNFMSNLMGDVAAARKSGFTKSPMADSTEKEAWDDVISGQGKQ